MQLTNVVVASLLGLAAAHPAIGGKPLPMSKRSLSHCQEHFAKRDMHNLDVARRAAEWRRLREMRGLQDKPVVHKRDFTDVLNKNHWSDRKVTPETDDAELFGESKDCVLSPEVTEGPLYVKGEEVRRNLTEGEAGVHLTLDIQVVDVNTCQPIPEVAVDFWSCNSTGVYGGVLDYPGNGNPDALDLINVTTLRGIQFSNENGVAVFDTLVPGHYAGRTNHMHVIAHMNTKTLDNGTITGGTISHVGQIFFDESFLGEVEKTEPYASNTQTWTQNEEDFIFQQGATGDDPVIEYVLLGDKVEDGVFGWIRMGVDPTVQKSAENAAYLDEEGGHMNPDFSLGNMGGMPSGGIPSGFIPTGAMPTGAVPT